jgi:hypothetical protein
MFLNLKTAQDHISVMGGTFHHPALLIFLSANHLRNEDWMRSLITIHRERRSTGREFMKKTIILAATASLIAGVAVAGTNDVKFPTNYATEYVLYHDVDKPNKKRGNTFRKFYINKAALAAVKAGKSLPSGTVLVREDWHVQQDDAKNPAKGANGRFIPTGKKGVVVMEKRTGWGAGYPASKRNGEWEYAAFKKDGKRNAKAKISRCFGCHMKVKGKDFVFTQKELKAAAMK